MKAPSHARVRKGLYIMVSAFLGAMATITGLAIYGNHTKAVTMMERYSISVARVPDHAVPIDPHAILAIWQRESLLISALAALFTAAVLVLSLVLSRRLRLLEYAEAQASAIIGTAMDGFWVTDTKGRLLDVNRAFCAMTGYSRDELLTMRIKDIEAQEQPEETVERIGKMQASGRDRFESRHRTRDGRIIDVEVSVNYLPMAGGRFVVFVRDITEIKKIQATLKESEETFHQLFEEAPDPILLIDGSNCFVDCNQAAVRMLGVASKEKVLLQHPSFFSPEYQPDGERSSYKADQIIRTVFGHTDMQFEWLHQRSDDSQFLVEVSLKLISLRGKEMQLVHWRDITDRKRIENMLRKLSIAVEQSPAAIVITDANGAIEYGNPKFYRMTEYTPEEVLGQNPRLLKSDLQPQEFYREMWETILSGREWRGEFHNRSKHGRLFWERASISPIRDNSGAITHFVAVKEDITEHKKLQEQLAQLAHFDILTGLPNRALFFDLCAQAMALARRENRRCAILFIDLDGFKAINDSHGHDIGDKVLCGAAQHIRACLRESDSVARMGGDEFTVILATLNQREDAALVARKIIARLAPPLTIGTTVCRVGASIGISIFPDDAEEVEKLLLHADSAMYEVKRTGRNNYRYFQE